MAIQTQTQDIELLVNPASPILVTKNALSLVEEATNPHIASMRIAAVATSFAIPTVAAEITLFDEIESEEGFITTNTTTGRLVVNFGNINGELYEDFTFRVNLLIGHEGLATNTNVEVRLGIDGVYTDPRFVGFSGEGSGKSGSNSPSVVFDASALGLTDLSFELGIQWVADTSNTCDITDLVFSVEAIPKSGKRTV